MTWRRTWRPGSRRPVSDLVALILRLPYEPDREFDAQCCGERLISCFAEFRHDEMTS